MEYILVYPNPAREIMHIRFFLTGEAVVAAGLNDITGRWKNSIFYGKFTAGEHVISIPLEGKEGGVYVLKMLVNGLQVNGNALFIEGF